MRSMRFEAPLHGPMHAQSVHDTSPKHFATAKPKGAARPQASRVYGHTRAQVVNLLSGVYTEFDKLCDKHDVYKVCTIGDA